MELNKTFIDGLWSKEINVTSFVQTNITPYLGDASFLQGPTATLKLGGIPRLPQGPRGGASAERHPFAGQQDRIDDHLAQGRIHRP